MLCVPVEATVAVVHRVVEVTPQGVRTRGDNNELDDPWLLAPADLLGKVVRAWRGASARPVAEGQAGHRQAARARRLSIANRLVSRVLHAPYAILGRSGVVRRIVPARLQPRVVAFSNSEAPARWRLMSGDRLIGEYAPAWNRWQIRRPFRLLVDETTLPVPRDPAGSNGSEPPLNTGRASREGETA